MRRLRQWLNPWLILWAVWGGLGELYLLDLLDAWWTWPGMVK